MCVCEKESVNKQERVNVAIASNYCWAVEREREKKEKKEKKKEKRKKKKRKKNEKQTTNTAAINKKQKTKKTRNETDLPQWCTTPLHETLRVKQRSQLQKKQKIKKTKNKKQHIPFAALLFTIVPLPFLLP